MIDTTQIKIGDILHTKYGKFKALENYAGPRFVDIKTDGGYVLLKSIIEVIPNEANRG